MPQTFDISQTPQNTKPPSSSGPSSRGTGTVVDDYARNILWVALFAILGLLAYAGYGLFGNAWSNPTFINAHGGLAQQQDNIGHVIGGLQIASIVAVLCIAVCAFRDEGIGYVLTVAAAIFYFGFPYASQLVYSQQGVQLVGPAKELTQLALTGIQTLGWICGVPGAIFMLVDFGRRFQAASEAAAIQRANVKYGSNVGRQSTKGQRFLGRCWELPYCREHVRAKCPIYMRRRGPCWWYKEGCMCEERIVLQAVIQEDWKKQQSTLGATRVSLTAPATPESHKIGLSAAPPKQLLSPAAKRERCRKCIIYNEHQRQKYKVWAAAAVVAVPTLLFLNKDWLIALANTVLSNVEDVTKKFSLSGGSSDTLLKAGDNVVLENILIFVLGLVILTQVLKLVEWMILKLKL